MRLYGMMRICMYHDVWGYNVLAEENKSLTNVGEFVKSWTTVEEYVCVSSKFS